LYHQQQCNAITKLFISLQLFCNVVTGRIDIHLNVNIPVDIELIEPVQESCIWCQTRGAATEISGVDEVPGSLYKVLLQIETF